MEQIREDVSQLYALLMLERRIVGVKLTETNKEYMEYQGKEIKSPITYCTVVKLAMKGQAYKLPKDMCSCKGASRALAFNKPEDTYYDGTGPCQLGLFDDKETASKVSNETKFVKEAKTGVVIKPLEQFEKRPDMVLIVTNTYNAMRIMQGYTSEFGLQQELCMCGNQAICVECTSNPYVRNNINISMMCSGTRFYAQWGRDEVGIGVPVNKFHQLVRGVRKTVNSVENDKEKERIIQGLKLLGESTEDIQMNYTYYLQLEREKRKEKEEWKREKGKLKN